MGGARRVFARGGRAGEDEEGARRARRGASRAGKGKGKEATMKALLLLVLPWLSPANYTDNLGNLHILYSEL